LEKEDMPSCVDIGAVFANTSWLEYQLVCISSTILVGRRIEQLFGCARGMPTLLGRTLINQLTAVKRREARK